MEVRAASAVSETARPAVESVGSSSSPPAIEPTTVTSSPEPLPDAGEIAVETPLPWKQVGALCLVLMNEGLCSSMLYPIVGLLVAHLEQESANDAGYLSGILVGLFQLGQVISGKLWGRFSDRYGRKPALFSGVFLSAFVVLLFGSATQFWACALLRFIHGLCNGNTLVGKAMIADITDVTNEARGFTIVSLQWALASFIGPAIGGFLFYSSSSSSSSSSSGAGPMMMTPSASPNDGILNPQSAWARHPAMLPCLVLSMYGFFASYVALFWLSESNGNAVPLRAHAILRTCLLRCLRLTETGARALRRRVREQLRSGSGDASQGEKRRGRYDAVARDGSSTDDNDDAPVNRIASHETQTPQEKHALTSQSQSEGGGGTAFGYREAFTSPHTAIPLLLYLFVSGTDIAFLETFPLWGIASQDVGGLGATSSTIGLLVVLNGIPAVIGNLCFPAVRRMCSTMTSSTPSPSGHFGSNRGDALLWAVAAVTASVSLAVMPLTVTFLRRPEFGLVFLSFFRAPAMAWLFSLSFVLIARSAPEGHRGAMNGIGQSVGCTARSLIPPIVAPLFAWSIKPTRWITWFPFNHAFVFLLASLFLLCSVAVSRRLLHGHRDGHHHRLNHDESVAVVGLDGDDGSSDELVTPVAVDDDVSPPRSTAPDQQWRPHHREIHLSSAAADDDEVLSL